jgi:hypothetical protein
MWPKTSAMKNNFSRNLILFLISVVFSLALIFAFIELPRLLDNLLQNNVGFPGFDHGLNDVDFETRFLPGRPSGK